MCCTSTLSLSYILFRRDSVSLWLSLPASDDKRQELTAGLSVRQKDLFLSLWACVWMCMWHCVSCRFHFESFCSCYVIVVADVCPAAKQFCIIARPASLTLFRLSSFFPALSASRSLTLCMWSPSKPIGLDLRAIQLMLPMNNVGTLFSVRGWR